MRHRFVFAITFSSLHSIFSNRVGSGSIMDYVKLATGHCVSDTQKCLIKYK